MFSVDDYIYVDALEDTYNQEDTNEIIVEKIIAKNEELLENIVEPMSIDKSSESMSIDKSVKSMSIDKSGESMSIDKSGESMSIDKSGNFMSVDDPMKYENLYREFQEIVKMIPVQD
ncbi:hypothetical protein HK096_000034 [Nowakowskiella sp. JEL0078]|nr:hypothetical protein HK096_000034 [Nowakowskiella sp. JEL0078]